ncbi:hypothetical protein JTE90_019847 [Oedothorax gibbosus]|uniref:PiggyBac transposable element-derived protein domain-containing protein n=1 Tax=Oedothorax gibbosus TaxID=931172 RepID=A0AAV6VYE2_9ARAC|nr:hypothetical protein JTE90_019847 [Oedothorax gibbosus]
MSKVYFKDKDGTKKLLTEDIWNALSSGSDISDDSDDDPTIDPNILFNDLDTVEQSESDCDVLEEDDINNDENVEINLPSTSKQNAAKKPTKKRKVKKTMLWKLGNLKPDPNSIAFSGDSSLPDNVTSLQTAFMFFSYFFPDELFQHIAEQTSLYSAQKRINQPVKIEPNDIRKYLGICILSSVAKFKNIRLFWNPVVGIDLVSRTMSLNNFELIRQFLHLNDNTLCDSEDKLFKLRPVIDILKEKFLSIPMEESLCVDEQMCATKARHHMKQYMPKKPHKYGFKLFVLAGVSGYAYNFEVYTGASNSTLQDIPDDLGASGSVVVRLTRPVPEHQNFKLYFDNYYTSVPLMTYLKGKGILCLGTVKSDRVPSSKIPNKKEMKKMTRGTIIEYVANEGGCEVSNLAWQDNKTVQMLSTFAGKSPVKDVSRYDRKTKSRISIPCPQVIQIYNKHMGGVDLHDSLLGRYKISMRTRKWYFRLFYHLLDLAIINSWLLYRRVKPGGGKTMKLIEFRLEIAETLCSYR